MSDEIITLELERIHNITPHVDHDEDAVILMRCIPTPECLRRLEGMVLKKLRQRNLTDAGIGSLADYIEHIGRREFNRQLAKMGYEIILTEEKSAELLDLIRKNL